MTKDEIRADWNGASAIKIQRLGSVSCGVDYIDNGDLIYLSHLDEILSDLEDDENPDVMLGKIKKLKDQIND